MEHTPQDTPSVVCLLFRVGHLACASVLLLGTGFKVDLFVYRDNKWRNACLANQGRTDHLSTAHHNVEICSLVKTGK